MRWKRCVFLSLMLIFCSTFSGAAQVADENLMEHSLSLAGYQLGMSYDDAVSIRPVQYADESSLDHHIVVFVVPFKVNDIELNLRFSSANGSVFKIIARFPPAKTMDILEKLQAELGPAENDIITYLSKEGREATQDIYAWTFPDARLHLVKNSNIKTFATLALVAAD